MKWIDRNVLITGINGFVGPYLAEELLKRGTNVYGLVRKRADGSKPKNLVDRRIIENVTLIEADLTDITSLASALDISEPDFVFHLASQSYVPRSFTHPLETVEINCMGTANLLEAIRIKNFNPIFVFAGSSEEYGLVFSSEKQYDEIKEKYKVIFPEPEKIPELPIKETNPLRPMSPYAVTKVFGDNIVRNYYHSYGMKTIVSRAFNHEGAGRGTMFVTSVVTSQIMKIKFGETDRIIIGNVNAFRDWSHIKDAVKGYCRLSEKGRHGDVYNQGSMRTNSVLSYILLSLEKAGWSIEKVESIKNNKVVLNPTERDHSEFFGIKFEKTIVDRKILDGTLEFGLKDKGIYVYTDKGKILIEFEKKRFRPAEVPILLSDTKKIRELGVIGEHRLEDIISDQLNYFIKKENRELL